MAPRDELRRLQRAEAKSVGKSAALEFRLLTVIGDALAERLGYGEGGVEACRRYAVDRFGWLPATARALSHSDLLFLLRELDPAEVRRALPAPPFGSGLRPVPPVASRVRASRVEKP